ncbi:MAG: hypothetical protein KGL39_02945 [Patescibacteria group bacterium]|nr:hypothetical protein [Patescibacteria group bacterium]
MKQLKLIAALAAIACACAATAQAQSTIINTTNLQAGLGLLGVGLQVGNGQSIVGQPLVVNGQNILVTETNGVYTITSTGPLGSEQFTPPSTTSGSLAQFETWLQQNNAANIGYYATNEIDARVGAAYLQNSGQAVAILSVQRYGWFGQPNVGVGLGLIQGNDAGKSGTAGEYGELDYRKPLGDVAAVGGAVGGWDEWNKKAFGGVKGGLEYRQSAHLGEWLDVIYVYEPNAGDRGLIIAGGVSLAF